MNQRNLLREKKKSNLKKVFQIKTDKNRAVNEEERTEKGV